MVEEKLSGNGYKVKISDLGDEAFKLFNDFLPQITIMNFSEAKVAGDLTLRMVEFDHTTCVFGFAPKVTHEIKTIAFASGVRALIQSNSLIEDANTAEQSNKQANGSADGERADAS